MNPSDQYRYQGPGAPHLTPGQFIRLGRLQQALSSPGAGAIIDSLSGDDDVDFSGSYGDDIDLTGETYEFTPDPDYDRVREFLAGAAIQLAEEGNEYALDTAEEADMDLDEYTAFQSAYDDSVGREQQRQLEDDQNATELRLLGPKRSEDRLSRAIERIGHGTYVPAGQFADRGNSSFELCGPSDAFGRCASVFHEPDCAHVTEAGAATGSYEDAIGWRQALNRVAASDPSRRAAVGLEYPRIERTMAVHHLAQSLGLTTNPDSPIAARTAEGARRQAEAALRSWQ